LAPRPTGFAKSGDAAQRFRHGGCTRFKKIIDRIDRRPSSFAIRANVQLNTNGKNGHDQSRNDCFRYIERDRKQYRSDKSPRPYYHDDVEIGHNDPSNGTRNLPPMNAKMDAATANH